MARNKSLALLIILVTAPSRTLPRDTIMALLWPRSDTDRARHSLNVAVYEIRKALGRDALVTVNGSLRLGPGLGSDIERFEAAIEAESWDLAARLYEGPFLEGFYYQGSEAFERWVEGQRSHLDRRYRVVLERRAERVADAETAVARWRELLAHDPASKSATIGLMRALEAMGRRPEAIDAAHAHRILMLEEYGASPDPDVEDLADRLREPPAAHGLPPRRAVQSPAPGPPARKLRPLVTFGALALFALLPLFVLGSRDHDPVTRESNRILVAGFENRTGDPTLDDLGPMAADWIAQELSKTGLMSPVLPVGELRSDGYQSEDRPMEMAGRAGAGLVLLGHYAMEEDSISFSAMIVRVPSGELVRTIDRVTESRSDPSLLVERLRQRTTGMLAAIVDDRLSPFVSAGTSHPPSYTAYRTFARGIELMQAREYREAAAAFHGAAARDTAFTLPLVYAVLSHRNAVYHPDPTRRDQLQAELADSVRGFLRARRDRLPPWESAWIDYLDEGSTDALRNITDMTPEPRWLLLRARKELHHARVGEALRILSGLEPPGPAEDWEREYFTTLLKTLHLAGDYDGEYEVLQQFQERYPPARPKPAGSYSADLYEIRILAALDRTVELEKSLEAIMQRALDPWEIQLPLMEVAIHGHGDLEVVRRARRWYLDRVLAEEPTDDPEELWRWKRAVGLRDVGRLADARAEFQRLLEHAAPGSDNPIIFMGALGQIAADRGDREEALSYDRRLETLDLESFREPNLSHAVRIQRINIAIALGEHRRAIAMLGEALEDRTPLFANGHPEMFKLRWLELRDDPTYQELVRPH